MQAVRVMSEVRVTPDRGLGLFSIHDYAIGDLVRECKNYLSLRHVNHSCDPNCGFQDEDKKQVYLRAIKPIAPGGEITLDYNTITFSHSTPSFECKCGSSNCRKRYENL